MPRSRGRRPRCRRPGTRCRRLRRSSRRSGDRPWPSCGSKSWRGCAGSWPCRCRSPVPGRPSSSRGPVSSGNCFTFSAGETAGDGVSDMRPPEDLRHVRRSAIDVQAVADRHKEGTYPRGVPEPTSPPQGSRFPAAVRPAWWYFSLRQVVWSRRDDVHPSERLASSQHHRA